MFVDIGTAAGGKRQHRRHHPPLYAGSEKEIGTKNKIPVNVIVVKFLMFSGYIFKRLYNYLNCFLVSCSIFAVWFAFIDFLNCICH